MIFQPHEDFNQLNIFKNEIEDLKKELTTNKNQKRIIQGLFKSYELALKSGQYSKTILESLKKNILKL